MIRKVVSNAQFIVVFQRIFLLLFYRVFLSGKLTQAHISGFWHQTKKFTEHAQQMPLLLLLITRLENASLLLL